MFLLLTYAFSHCGKANISSKGVHLVGFPAHAKMFHHRN